MVKESNVDNVDNAGEVGNVDKVDNVGNVGKVLSALSTLNKGVSGNQRVLELKHSTTGIITWSTRGHLGLDPNSKNFSYDRLPTKIFNNGGTY